MFVYNYVDYYSSLKYSNCKPPWGKSVEWHPLPVTVHMIVLSLFKNSEHKSDIGRCLTITPSFVIFTCLHISELLFGTQMFC